MPPLPSPSPRPSRSSPSRATACSEAAAGRRPEVRVFDWYEEASAAERRTFWGCLGGWALDAMDVQLYSLAIPALITAWGISQREAGLLATVALLFSAVGGWIAGLLSDRIGRVRTLQITILWFAFFTFVSGFAQ